MSNWVDICQLLNTHPKCATDDGHRVSVDQLLHVTKIYCHICICSGFPHLSQGVLKHISFDMSWNKQVFSMKWTLQGGIASWNSATDMNLEVFAGLKSNHNLQYVPCELCFCWQLSAFKMIATSQSVPFQRQHVPLSKLLCWAPAFWKTSGWWFPKTMTIDTQNDTMFAI